MRAWFALTLVILGILGCLALALALILTVGFAFSTGTWWALLLIPVYAAIGAGLYLGMIELGDWIY
jgi:hypothetical protein